MKKIISILAIVLALSIFATACGGSKPAESPKTEVSTEQVADATPEDKTSEKAVESKTDTPAETPAKSTENAEEITLEQAKKIALDHAGLKEEDVTFVKEKLDYDDGRKEYEIEFYSGDTEYDYDIDAKTGEIISFDKDIEHFDRTKKVDDSELIGEQKAKEIALAKVPGATEKDIRKFKLDRDDGKVKYEGEIFYEGVEYEFDIDAVTGEILDWDIDN